MRIAIALALLIAGFAGCAGDAPPDSERRCMGGDYDPCLTEHDCMSNNCRLFMGDGFRICTTSCTVGDDSMCPAMADGRAATCNMMGLCKPPAPNSCAP
jgi:hypothetical protein